MRAEAARSFLIDQYSRIKNFSDIERIKFKQSLMTSFKLPKWYTEVIRPHQIRSIYEQMNSKNNAFGEFRYFYTFNHDQLSGILNGKFHIPNWYLRMLDTKQMRQICEMKFVIAQKVDYMTDHEYEVSKIVKELAPCFGLNEEETRILGLIALFHDIGKVNVATEYLNAREHKLTEDEYNALVKPHAFFSGEIFKDYPILRDYCGSTKYHHKHWTGQGYPRESEEDENICEQKIPIFSRILSIADSYQAMIDERGYKVSKSRTEACIELIEQAGFQFDPILAYKAAAKLGGFANKTIDYTANFKYSFENVKRIHDLNSGHTVERKVTLYEGEKSQSIKFDKNNEVLAVLGTWTIKSKGIYLVQAITNYYLRGIMFALGLKDLNFNTNVWMPLEELFVNSIKYGCWEGKHNSLSWSEDLCDRDIRFDYLIEKEKMSFSLYYPSKPFDLNDAFKAPDPYLRHHRGVSLMVKNLVDNLEYNYDDNGYYTVNGDIPLLNPKSIASKKRQK
jgi:HD-GYP domain-containing protein (c-di-GMP phosphodiesterase class II)